MSAFDTDCQVNTLRADACQGTRRIETPEPDEPGVKLSSTREGKKTCAPRDGDQADSVRPPDFQVDTRLMLASRRKRSHQSQKRGLAMQLAGRKFIFILRCQTDRTPELVG
jgi:hypothetical protein